jgi:hypothetical protein
MSLARPMLRRGAEIGVTCREAKGYGESVTADRIVASSSAQLGRKGLMRFDNNELCDAVGLSGLELSHQGDVVCCV